MPRPAPTPTPKPEPSQENTPVDQSLVEFTQFKRLPFDIENVSAVSPIGGFGGIHTRSNPMLVRPYGQERHVIWNKTPGKPYNVYAPATTYIFSVWKSPTSQYGLSFKIYGDYRDGRFSFDHIHILNPELESEIISQLGESWGGGGTSWLYLPNPILVHEGDILGQTSVYTFPSNWDWLVVDETRHEGVIAPDHYRSNIFAYSRSVYDLCTDEVKQQLRSLAGKPGVLQKGQPILGQFGSDVPGTLSGTWFYDVTDDSRWGPKLAIFRPYHMDSSKVEIKLAMPELDLYGVWIISPSESGNTNPEPTNVTPESGIVYYVLDSGSYYTEEFGLLIVQLNKDNTVTLETQRDHFDHEDFNEFTGNELTLTR
jgi:hypothetical protein